MYILNETLERIKQTVGKYEPECGGIISINEKGIIADFYFDGDAGVGKPCYIPSRLSIQNYVRKVQKDLNLTFCGVVHSHPICNVCEPSYIDIEMACKIMLNNSMKLIYLIIVNDNEIKMFSISGNKSPNRICRKEEIKII